MSDESLPRGAARFMPDRRHFLAVVLGALFALGLHQIWSLNGLYFYASIVALLGISTAMFLVGVFSEFLTLCFLYAIPVAGMGPWWFPGNLRLATWSTPNHNASLEGALGVGPVDFLVAGLLLSWFGRVFVLREQRLEGLNIVDAFVIVFLVAFVLSIPGSPKPNLGLHATYFLIKFILLYFYFSRNLQLKHVKWFVFSMVIIIGIQGSLGLLQHFTGKLVGIGMGRLDYQYVVPGTEAWHRATGTLYDSHTLGLYLAMMVPFMYVFAFASFVSLPKRALYAGAFVFGMIALVATFTRSGWVASAVSMSLLVPASLFVWKEKQVVPLLMLGLFCAILTAPWTLELIIERFQRSPAGTLSVRFEGYVVGLHIWSKYPIFGIGAGNYMEALWRHNFGWNQDVIVHNTIIWLGSTVGIVGVIGFYGAILSAVLKMWRIGKNSKVLTGRCAFAIVFALIAFSVEGMATPMHREPATYTMFWFLLALARRLPYLHQTAYGQATAPAGPRPMPERRGGAP